MTVLKRTQVRITAVGIANFAVLVAITWVVCWKNLSTANETKAATDEAVARWMAVDHLKIARLELGREASTSIMLSKPSRTTNARTQLEKLNQDLRAELEALWARDESSRIEVEEIELKQAEFLKTAEEGIVVASNDDQYKVTTAVDSLNRIGDEMDTKIQTMGDRQAAAAAAQETQRRDDLMRAIIAAIVISLLWALFAQGLLRRMFNAHQTQLQSDMANHPTSDTHYPSVEQSSPSATTSVKSRQLTREASYGNSKPKHAHRLDLN
jgi:hypothetical protein